MNALRFKRLLSRSGPIPHNDPPKFKSSKIKRVIPFGEHLLWFANDFTAEYFINLKHMYLRNLGGTLMQIMKIFFGGVILPTSIICYLKSVSQDTRNYYRDEFTIYSGPLAAPNNMKEMIGKLREYHSAPYQDLLGRKSHQFYKTLAPIEIRLDLPGYHDDYIRRKDDYIGKK